MKKIALILILTISGMVHANLIVVNSNLDTVASDGQCTLREALTAANFDVFVADCNATGLGDDLIWLLLGSSGDAIQLNSQLPIIDGVFIQGPGADNLVLFPANNHSGHIFQINTDQDVTLQGFRIGGSQTSAVDVVNVRDLEILDMEFHNNQAGSNEYGGAIHADVQDGSSLSVNSLLVENALFQSNTADYGGAIAAGGAYPFTVNNSVFISNNATTVGGAIARYYRLSEPIENVVTSINNSQFKQNSGNNGIIALLQQTLDINESLFQNNTGISTISALSSRGAIRNSIFAERTSGNAIFVSGLPSVLASIISIDFNTFINQTNAVDLLIANNASATITGNAFAGTNSTRCQELNFNTLLSNGYNLEAMGSSCTSHNNDLPNTDAELMPLALYGGDILIAPPHPLSPLVDAGLGCNSNDISGEGRSRDGDANGQSRCDIGAVERPNAHNLFIGFDGNGEGEINLSEFDLACSTMDSTCTWPLPQNETFSFNASPNPGSTFIQWDLECSGDMGCDITMDNFKFLTAEFASLANPVTLTVNKFFDSAGLSATAISSPAGINCGPDCSADFLENDEVVLSASLGEDAVIDTWSGCDSIQNDECHITLTVSSTVSLFVMQDPDIIFKNSFD